MSDRWVEQASFATRCECVGYECACVKVIAAALRSAYEQGLEDACAAACYYCKSRCVIATTDAQGHPLPYNGHWHVNDVDPMVLSKCEASSIRSLKQAGAK